MVGSARALGRLFGAQALGLVALAACTRTDPNVASAPAPDGGAADVRERPVQCPTGCVENSAAQELCDNNYVDAGLLACDCLIDSAPGPAGCHGGNWRPFKPYSLSECCE